MFAERGYTAVEVDIEAGTTGGTAVDRMKGMVSGKQRCNLYLINAKVGHV
jgi:hypothetical protein